MVLAVIGQRVAFVVGAADDLGEGARHAPDHEEGGLHAFARQDVEDARGVGRQRPVIEGDDDFLVVERQQLPILDAAEQVVLGRIDHDGAAGPQRAGVSGAFGREDRSGNDQRCQQAV